MVLNVSRRATYLQLDVQHCVSIPNDAHPYPFDCFTHCHGGTRNYHEQPL